MTPNGLPPSRSPTSTAAALLTTLSEKDASDALGVPVVGTVAVEGVAVAMLTMALVAALSAVMFPPKTWSWVANLGLPLFSAVLFLGEHAYRSVRFRHLGHNSPLTTLKTLTRPHLWMSP